MANYSPTVSDITRNSAIVKWDGADIYPVTSGGTVKVKLSATGKTTVYGTRGTKIENLSSNTTYTVTLYYVENDEEGGTEINLTTTTTFKTLLDYSISVSSKTYNSVTISRVGPDTYDDTGYVVKTELLDSSSNVLNRSAEKNATFTNLSAATSYTLRLSYFDSDGTFKGTISGKTASFTTYKWAQVAMNCRVSQSNLYIDVTYSDCDEVTVMTVKVDGETKYEPTISSSGSITLGPVQNLTAGVEHIVTIVYAQSAAQYSISDTAFIPEGSFTVTTFDTTGIQVSTTYAKSGWTNRIALYSLGENGTSNKLLCTKDGSSVSFTPTEMGVSDITYQMKYKVQLFIVKDSIQSVVSGYNYAKFIKIYTPNVLYRNETEIGVDNICSTYEETAYVVGVGLYNSDKSQVLSEKTGNGIVFDNLTSGTTYFLKEYYVNGSTKTYIGEYVQVSTIHTNTATIQVAPKRYMANVKITNTNASDITKIEVLVQKKLSTNVYSDAVVKATITTIVATGYVQCKVRELDQNTTYKLTAMYSSNNYEKNAGSVVFTTLTAETDEENSNNVIEQVTQTQNKMYKPFLISVGDAGAYSNDMEYEEPFDTLESYGLYIKHSPFTVYPQIKDIVTQDWLDEQGDDVYLPLSGVMNQSYELEVEFIYLANDGLATVNIRRFVNKIKGKWLKIYDSYTKLGRQGVYVQEFDKDPEFKSRRKSTGEVQEYVSFKVQFKVNDPNTDIILTQVEE